MKKSFKRINVVGVVAANKLDPSRNVQTTVSCCVSHVEVANQIKRYQPMPLSHSCVCLVRTSRHIVHQPGVIRVCL